MSLSLSLSVSVSVASPIVKVRVYIALPIQLPRREVSHPNSLDYPIIFPLQCGQGGGVKQRCIPQVSLVLIITGPPWSLSNKDTVFYSKSGCTKMFTYFKHYQWCV